MKLFLLLSNFLISFVRAEYFWVNDSGRLFSSENGLLYEAVTDFTASPDKTIALIKLGDNEYRIIYSGAVGRVHLPFKMEVLGGVDKYVFLKAVGLNKYYTLSKVDNQLTQLNGVNAIVQFEGSAIVFEVNDADSREFRYVGFTDFKLDDFLNGLGHWESKPFCYINDNFLLYINDHFELKELGAPNRRMYFNKALFASRITDGFIAVFYPDGIKIFDVVKFSYREKTYPMGTFAYSNKYDFVIYSENNLYGVMNKDLEILHSAAYKSIKTGSRGVFVALSAEGEYFIMNGADASKITMENIQHIDHYSGLHFRVMYDDGNVEILDLQELTKKREEDNED